jgi:hypothetical protein
VQQATHTLEDYLRTRVAVPAFGSGVVFPDGVGNRGEQVNGSRVW